MGARGEQSGLLVFVVHLFLRLGECKMGALMLVKNWDLDTASYHVNHVLLWEADLGPAVFV